MGNNDSKDSRSPLERFLGLFANVRAGEGATVVLLALNVFLLLLAYYIIKPIREALILSGGGAEVKSYAAAGQAILLIGVVPLYAMLVTRLARRRLINIVTIFFVACLGIFYILSLFQPPLLFEVDVVKFQADLDNANLSQELRGKFEEKNISLSADAAISVAEEGGEWTISENSKKTYSIRKWRADLSIYPIQFQMALGVPFYLWVGIFNLMVIAQFWSFANDLYTPEAGKRLFATVAIGASAGAVLGGRVAKILIEPLGIYQLLLVAGALLLSSLVVTNIVGSRERKRASEHAAVGTAEEPISKGGAFQLVFKNKYLLLIALLMLFLNWVNTTGEYILGDIVKSDIEQKYEEEVAAGTKEALPELEYGVFLGKEIGKFYADFFSVVNLVGLAIQLFLVSRIIKYLGVKIALFILPVIALGGYAFLVFVPVLSIVRWAKTAENSTDYSLQNTVRQMLFLPTTREQKYKAKQAIDTFFVRAGDVLSACLVYVGLHWLTFSTKHFALANLVLILVWIFLAALVGRENRRLTTDSE